MIRSFFLNAWKAKLLSLAIATGIWLLIKSHLDAENPSFPVPGTGTQPPSRSSTVPGLDETLLNTLTPPVPGDKGGK